MTQVDVRSVAGQIDRLLERVAAGEIVIVADAAGQPVAQLAPVSADVQPLGSSGDRSATSDGTGRTPVPIAYQSVSPAEPPARLTASDAILAALLATCGSAAALFGASGTVFNLTERGYGHVADAAGCAALAVAGLALAVWPFWTRCGTRPILR